MLVEIERSNVANCRAFSHFIPRFDIDEGDGDVPSLGFLEIDPVDAGISASRIDDAGDDAMFLFYEDMQWRGGVLV